MNAHPSVFDPDDPRLTAYALGELTDPADRAAVEQTLQASPEARAALREIREFTAALSAEYEQERSAAGETPRNIITLTPRRSRSIWPGLLLAAAMLVLVASVVGLRMRINHAPAAIFSVTQGLTHRIQPPTSAVASVKKSVLPTSRSSAAGSTADKIARAETAPTPPLVAFADTSKDISASGTVQAATASGSLDDLSKVAPRDEPVPAAAMPALASDLKSEKQVVAATPAASFATALPAVHFDTPFEGPRVASATSSTGPNSTSLIQTRSRNLASSNAMGGGETAPARYGFAEENASEASAALPAPGLRRPLPENPGTAVYEHRTENPFLSAKDNPLSTFSIDVDTASYANVRRFIESGRLPPADAVRIEELVNYFPYTYAPPAPGDERPFAVGLEAASCPWNPQDRLVRIGIKGRELARGQRPPSNLVFLLDVSGSMEPPERLPLIKSALHLLVEQLREDDHVAIVTYAGESGIALPSATGDQKERILRVIDALQAGGSTNGAAGIKLAYQVAREGFIKGGTNRVILATDGDFNVGVTSQSALVRMIETEAKSGVALSTLGVGTDNYKDATMQKLADKGNGNYHYIDKLDEARKVLVEQLSGTLVTIAKDVKIQVEFNPATVAAYRLLGYEKRLLRKEDFHDDRVDAGEIGAGHCVTALYEVVPAGQPVPQATPAVDALKYASPPAPTPQPDVAAATPARELLTVKLRHKAPDGDASERSYEEALIDHGAPGDFSRASADFKFAAAVADFGLALRDSPNKGGATLGAAIELAQEGLGADPGGYRAGFIELARRAEAIQREHGE